MMTVVHATLYTKPGCHLCEDAQADLKRLRRRYPHTLALVDITRDADLVRRYWERIPVLRVGAQEWGAPLTPALLERALRQAADARC